MLCQEGLEIAGAKAPGDMQGQSLVPLLDGKTPQTWRTALYYHYYEYPSVHMVARHYGIRSNRHKLIYYYQFDEWEFFDLETDPNELTSRYDDPEYADLINQHKAELARLQRELGEDDPHGAVPGDPGRRK